MRNYSFTSESVCNGHPDKICDAISDAIVDGVLAKDKYGRVAVEVLVTYNRAFIAGEVTTNASVDFEKIARSQIKRLGYIDGKYNFSYLSPLEIYVHRQSPDIDAGVAMKGAGDQGMMFGYACRETEELMPMPIMIAHRLVKNLDMVREKKLLPYIRTDGKSQVTVKYKDGKPVSIHSVVMAVPHDEDIKLSEVKSDIYKYVVRPVLEKYGFSFKEKELVVNGTGVWHMSGPAADTGVTGRKIIVDTYGGYAKVGGGCFSGKDPTKVDRSGAYAARFLAKNAVAQKLVERIEISLAYFIGAKKPVMQEIETFGTEKTSMKVLRDFMAKTLDTSVEGIIEGLDLRRPIYLQTSAYGHFGRKGLPWEKI